MSGCRDDGRITCGSTDYALPQVLTYYGGIKERKAKRIGWTKPNAFHVCVTSYQMVLADASVFRRKKWHFLILDVSLYTCSWSLAELL